MKAEEIVPSILQDIENIAEIETRVQTASAAEAKLFQAIKESEVGLQSMIEAQSSRTSGVIDSLRGAIRDIFSDFLSFSAYLYS